MALVKGDAKANTGMAGAIFTALNAAFGPFAESDLKGVHPFCNALADGIIEHIINNADVVGGTSDGATITSGAIE